MTPADLEKARAAARNLLLPPEIREMYKRAAESGEVALGFGGALERRHALADAEAKEQETRLRVRNLVIAGMRNDLPPAARRVVHNPERSARAELKLRVRAVEFLRGDEPQPS